MKKYGVLRIFTDYVTRNRLQFLFAILCLVSGTVIGSLSAASLNDEKFNILSSYINNFTSAYGIQSVSHGEVFSFSLYNKIKLLLFMWISGLWTGLIPFGLFQLGLKGYKLAYTTFFLIQLHRGSGIIFALVAVIPQILIMLPTLICYSVFNINSAISFRRLRQKGQGFYVQKELCLRNLLCLVAVVVVFVISSLIDAFVVPAMLKPVCSLLSK